MYLHFRFIAGSVQSDSDEAEREERQIVGGGRWRRRGVAIAAYGQVAALLATFLAASRSTGNHESASGPSAWPRNVAVPAGRQKRVVPAIERDAAQTTATGTATAAAGLVAASRHWIGGGATAGRSVDDFRGRHNVLIEPNDGTRSIFIRSLYMLYYIILWFSVVGIFSSL